MALTGELITYKLDDFLKYKSHSKTIPETMIPYCYANKKTYETNINSYNDQMKLIIDTISKGIDTNDIVFKNDIKYFINTLNRKNFTETVKKILKFDMQKKENLHFLINELIICAIRCPIAVKGIHHNKEKNDKTKVISEITADIMRVFASEITKEKNNGIGFQDELLKICRKYFMDFVNVAKSMDQNNENTCENYKGFMTLLGLLFENNLFPHKIVIDCMNSIKRTMFCSIGNKSENNENNENNEKILLQHEKMFGYEKMFSENSKLYENILYYDSHVANKNNISYRNIVETTNFYRGYENFTNHYLNYYKKKVIANNKEENTNLRTQMLQFIASHEEITVANEFYKIQNKGEQISPLKQYIKIIHCELLAEMRNILQMLD